jgi:hypothetical protein
MSCSVRCLRAWTFGVGRERLGAEQASDLVQGGGHMDLAVGVDATGDGAARLPLS